MDTAYLAFPYLTDTNRIADYLYRGSEIVESSNLGTIVSGPATGGFSMAITADRLASGLIFASVHATLADARVCLYMANANFTR